MPCIAPAVTGTVSITVSVAAAGVIYRVSTFMAVIHPIHSSKKLFFCTVHRMGYGPVLYVHPPSRLILFLQRAQDTPHILLPQAFLSE